MIELFRPDIYQKSIYHINYEKLKESGIKCLLFDLENTLVPFVEKEPSERLINFINGLKDLDLKVIIFSNKHGEILRFLNSFFNLSQIEQDAHFSDLEWEKKYKNPIDMADIIGSFIENNENYKINMWVSLDQDVLINVTENNADDIIRYLYERFPY